MRNKPQDSVPNQVAMVNDEIAVGEDLSFQRRWWRFERMAWVFLSLVILMDLSGAFGRGPLSRARMGSADQPVKVDYERIERTGTPSLLNITLGKSARADGHFVLFVSDDVFSDLGAQRVVPQPAESRIGEGGITYTFPAQGAPATVRLELSPPHPGVFTFRLRAENSGFATGKIWVVP